MGAVEHARATTDGGGECPSDQAIDGGGRTNATKLRPYPTGQLSTIDLHDRRMSYDSKPK